MPFNSGDHKFFHKLDDLIDLQSVRWHRWEQVKIAPVRIGEFHHDKRMDLNIELETFGELIKEVDESVQSESLLVSFLGDDKTFIDVILLVISESELLRIDIKVHLVVGRV